MLQAVKKSDFKDFIIWISFESIRLKLITHFFYIIMSHCFLSIHQISLLTFNISLFLVVKDFPGIVIAEEPQWKDCIQGSTGVVNLAGLPISTRWSPEVGNQIIVIF